MWTDHKEYEEYQKLGKISSSYRYCYQNNLQKYGDIFFFSISHTPTSIVVPKKLQVHFSCRISAYMR